MRTARWIAVLALTLATGCQSPSRAPRAERPEPSTPLVQPSTGSTPSTPAPVTLSFRPAHYAGWLNRIPQRLPLAAGLPELGYRSHDQVHLNACDDDVFGHRGESIDQHFLATSGPEDDERRGVLLFADDRAAATYLRQSLARAQACPTEAHDDTTLTWQVRRGHLGPRFTPSFLVVQTASEQGRPPALADWWEAARIGSAVLVTSVGGQASPDDVDQAIKHNDRALRPLVDSLCVFTSEGCPVVDPDISTAFPLAAGYPGNDGVEGPSFGREGPSRALPVGSFELCDRRAALPAPRDQMGAGWSNPEDFRSRHLLTFTDATAASDWVGSLNAFWTSCPREPTGGGFVGLQTLRRTTVGGESWALVRNFRYHGAPGVGLDVLQVVRLGRAVLLDEVSNEGGAGPEREAEISGVLEGMTKASRRVVGAMCAYTEAGCPK